MPILRGVVLVGVLACAACALRDTGGVASAVAALPPGEGRAILERECLKCHELDALALFAGFYTRERWRSLVLTMRDNGAVVDDEDVEVLATYLGRNFGTGDD